ncbi:hypothetical protein Xoosp13_240 [Xanthomonas phage Xoo-sp13]|nr:hypothetical protein Xoosp13_240 [Xanthomonas phage Xoo-sp13]
MEFLKKLVNKVVTESVVQSLTEEQKKVQTSVPAVRIGDFIVKGSYVIMEVRHDDGFESEERVTEIALRIERGENGVYQVQVFPSAPVSTDKLLDGHGLNGASIKINVLNDNNLPDKIQDSEKEQFLKRLVAGYLSQYIDKIVAGSVSLDRGSDASPLSRFSTSDEY